MGHVDMVSGECRCGWPHNIAGWSEDEAGALAQSVQGGSAAATPKLCFDNGEGKRTSWRRGIQERSGCFEEVDWAGWSGGSVFGVEDWRRPCTDFLREFRYLG